MGSVQQLCCKKQEKDGIEDEMGSSLNSYVRESFSKPMESSEIAKMNEQVSHVKQKFQEIRQRYPLNAELRSLNEKEIWPVKVTGIGIYFQCQLLGRGAFGKVYLVRLAKSPHLFALKQIKKKFLVRQFQVENLMYEKMILQCHEHPFLVKLHHAFQDKVCVSFIVDFVQGGELFHHLRKRQKFDEEMARFYGGQIILALEYLHTELKVVYRDLKPENILICEDGYIKLTDFGLAKSSEALCYSFCGTPEYLAPEIILEKGHGTKVDIWTLGCLMYEMLFGCPPFRHQSKKALYDAIVQKEVQYPGNTNSNLITLLNQLLDKNPENRPELNQLKLHPFFAGIDWDKLLQKQVPAPFQPILMNKTDTRNFDYLKESAMLQSISQLHPSEQEQVLFDDFDFIQTKSLLKLYNP